MISRIEISDNPTLHEIVETVKQHYIDNPTHGAGCSCIDIIASTIRRNVAVYSLTERIEDRTGNVRKIQNAIVGVFLQGTRNL